MVLANRLTQLRLCNCGWGRVEADVGQKHQRIGTVKGCWMFVAGCGPLFNGVAGLDRWKRSSTVSCMSSTEAATSNALSHADEAAAASCVVAVALVVVAVAALVVSEAVSPPHAVPRTATTPSRQAIRIPRFVLSHLSLDVLPVRVNTSFDIASSHLRLLDSILLVDTCP
jgi:hypothetical protein